MKEIFDGQMLIMTLPTTLLESICKIIFNSKVIYKSITDPDDNLLEELLSINGLSLAYVIVISCLLTLLLLAGDAGQVIPNPHV